MKKADRMLWEGVEGNDLRKVALALNLGANMKFCDEGTIWTPLHRASVKNYFKIANLLIQNGADINAIDTFGYTPLVWAVKCDAFEIADVLLQMGSSVEKTRDWIDSDKMMHVFKKHKIFKK
jgi:ankyrin repeat protein